MEEILLRTLLKEIKETNDKDYVGHEQEKERVMGEFGMTIDNIYDDFSMNKNVREILREMEEDMENFQFDLKKHDSGDLSSASSSDSDDSSFILKEEGSEEDGSYDMHNEEIGQDVKQKNSLKTFEDGTEVEGMEVQVEGMECKMSLKEDEQMVEQLSGVESWEVMMSDDKPIKDESDQVEEKSMANESENSSKYFASILNDDDNVSRRSEKKRVLDSKRLQCERNNKRGN